MNNFEKSFEKVIESCSPLLKDFESCKGDMSKDELEKHYYRLDSLEIYIEVLKNKIGKELNVMGVEL